MQRGGGGSSGKGCQIHTINVIFGLSEEVGGAKFQLCSGAVFSLPALVTQCLGDGQK